MSWLPWRLVAAARAWIFVLMTIGGCVRYGVSVLVLGGDLRRDFSPAISEWCAGRWSAPPCCSFEFRHKPLADGPGSKSALECPISPRLPPGGPLSRKC